MTGRNALGFRSSAARVLVMPVSPPPDLSVECAVLQTEIRKTRVAPSIWLVAACLAAVYVIWGTTYFALKVGLEGAGPYCLVGTRFVVAGGVLMAWLWMSGHPLPQA